MSTSLRVAPAAAALAVEDALDSDEELDADAVADMDSDLLIS
jgi:hypothetical protein